MSTNTEHQHTTATARTTATQGSVAGAGGAPHPRARLDRAALHQFEALPVDLQERLLHVARHAVDQDAALAPAIDVLAPGPDQQRAAIIAAFRRDPRLAEQWSATYRLLQQLT